ncbi:MAG: diguanylate cyclase [Bacillota bacterium]|nr:diguanylate cyclase [Bacillota bacterium]
MKGKSGRLTFGLFIDWITGWGDTDFYQSIVYSGVSDFAKENDINLITYVTGRVDSDREWERSKNVIARLANEDMLDGIIITPSCFNKKQSVLKIPMVILGEQIDGYSCTYVDNYGGMKAVIDHLIEIHHCRRIAFIKGRPGNKEAEGRFRAYIDSLEKHDIPYNPKLVYQGDFGFDSGCNAMREILSKHIEIDGLVGANDNMIIGAIIECYRTMGSIPHDMHIAGFDDTEGSRIQRLTTVRQSFYDMAKSASGMLLKLVKGCSGPLTEEVSAEMVIRSSCGCIPSIIESAKIETKLNGTEPFCRAFADSKDKLIVSLLEWNHKHGFDMENEDTKAFESYEEKLLIAFYKEYCLGSKNAFVNVWDDLIFWMALKKLNIQLLQELLSEVRRELVGCLSESDDMILAENLFHTARVQIFDAAQRAKENAMEASTLRTLEFDPLAEELVSTGELEFQMELTYRYLPEMGIKKGFVALYENPDEPLEFSRLLLAYNEKDRFNINSGEGRFPTEDILPESIWSELEKERYNILIQALHHGESQLGYIIMSFNFKPNRTLENIRHRLSVAIKGAELLGKIKNQALDLERQVVERTRELSLTNVQLLEEVAKRREAEEQLKKAMQDLENYAETLRTQSVHDELTGLYNRRGFMTLGREKFEEARLKGHSCTIFFADLDGLKQINDNYGHEEGDNAIARTAEILVKVCGDSDIIARLGGDEFTVLTIGTDFEDAGLIAGKINHLCEIYNQTSNKPYKMSISIGSAYFTKDSELDFEKMMREADHKLYNEKQWKKERLKRIVNSY